MNQIVTYIAPKLEKLYYPKDVVPHTFYITAQGHHAYAWTKSIILLLNDPNAKVLMVNDDRYERGHYAGRFPFTRAPEGSCVELRQFAEVPPEQLEMLEG
jgi:hypothetical protein